ncbi:Hypothetical predicted protein [Mytilus galloprovincialis]|uniref:Integrase catalytic domain-containing protein n=1 Tax=Mytilus galloprovincialis TaxID=29158 RepID=A0A8B6D0B2_MYTGA|nr:Hypothetical predicted protein [Mytilus galloprovincialis]
MGKAKVAPLHGHCIPRFELCAAVLAVQISETVSTELDIDRNLFRFFSDSKVVLVGIDTFGPWSIVTRKTRGGQANSKRWALLFTCLSTRAIHIEVIEELSLSSFINALRRFIALRGSIKEIRSDRGANFVGSVVNLNIASINVEEGPVHKCLEDKQTVWIFNPHIPHIWEECGNA